MNEKETNLLLAITDSRTETTDSNIFNFSHSYMYVLSLNRAKQMSGTKQ